MCDVTLALAIGGTLFSAYSQMQQANSAAAAAEQQASNNRNIAEYNAKVAETNADIEKKNANDAMQRGASDAAVQRENSRKANATARASAASTGLLADSGTVGELQSQNVVYGEMNALTAMNNAERDAYGYNMKAYDYLNEATNLRYQGDVGVSNAGYEASVTRQNGLLSAASTLVSGGYNLYKGYKTSSTFADGSAKVSNGVRWNTSRSGSIY